MGDYIEYYTVAYRNEQRVVILNDSAKPTPRPPSKPKRSKYYVPVQKKNDRRRPSFMCSKYDTGARN